MNHGSLLLKSPGPADRVHLNTIKQNSLKEVYLPHWTVTTNGKPPPGGGVAETWRRKSNGALEAKASDHEE